MSTRPKQIIVDKSAFIGINIDKLCDFAQNHLLLACDTLMYECATATKQEPRDMLHNYKRLIESGAYYCSCSVVFIQSEGKNCCSYPWFLPDLDATEQIRTGKARLENVLDSAVPEKAFQSHCKIAKAMFVDLSDKLKRGIDSERLEVGKEIKNLPLDRLTRLQKLFEQIDTSDLHNMVVDSVLKDWIKNETKFCLSSEWISWQYVRLNYIIVWDYCYSRQMGGMPGNRRAEHDYQDMEYALLLSRADGLLTKDKKLAELAKAAFPKRNVVSSPEEIPEDYLCRWN